MSIQDLRIADIRTDGGTQPRAKLDPATVGEYSEAMRAGAEFPPVVVFYDGTAYWLADGFHRIDAAKETGRETIPADVRDGGKRDAVLYSTGANATHGLRRTNADKWRAVATLLCDPEWRQWSDNEIARRCAVSQPFVGKVCAEVAPTYNDYKSRKGADGRTINTAKIGATPRPQNPYARYDGLPFPFPCHPALEIIPLMAGQTLPGLVEDIRQHGLLNPIVTYKGMILDGRLRYLACIEAGVIPRFREYDGDDSDGAPAAYVRSMNLLRQSFTEDQRAFFALDFADALEWKREHGTFDGWAPRHTVTDLEAEQRALKDAYEAADGEYLKKIHDDLKDDGDLWPRYLEARDLTEETAQERIRKAEDRAERPTSDPDEEGGAAS